MKAINWWAVGSRYISILIGTFIGAFSVIIFMMPSNISPVGVTGISVMLNYLIGTPIGVFILILNIPIQVFAYKMLPGSWRTVALTGFVLVSYSIAIDILVPILPTGGVSDNVLLNAIFGGALGGISGGIIIRNGATFGGTSTLAFILQRRTGTPMSSTFLYTDTLVVVGAGFVYGWEPALYAVVALFISGVATDYVLEGPSVVRTALIVTNKPEQVSEAILYQLHRGLTGWLVKGMYTGEERWMLFASISRSEVRELNLVVNQADPTAFVTIMQGHVVYGEGFKQFRGKSSMLRDDTDHVE